MPEIPCSRFRSYLAETPPAALPQVWLIFGEEAFCGAAAADLIGRLLPGPEKAFGYDPVDNDDVSAAIERVSTFSLFSGTRVIALPDSRIFYSREDHQGLLKKAREAFEDDQVPKAVRHFTAALGLLSLSLADAAQLAPGQKGVKIDPDLWGDGGWVTALLDWCRDKGLAPSPAADRCGELQQAAAKGFPAGNHLLITTELVDKRRGLYKTILEKGAVVNCSVPMGGGRQDVVAREALLADHTRSILGRSGKEMAQDAYRLMSEMTGFDIRTLTANLEKLIQFSGEAPVITAADVREVLTRTRQDPVYELTGALSDRNVEGVLRHLDALLQEGLVPLQILAAMINAMRRMLLAKGFGVSPPGRAWHKGMGFNDFQRSVMPAIQEWDQALLSSLAEWDEAPEGDPGADPKADQDGGKKNRRGAAGPMTDLVIAPKGKNAYPIYLLLKNSERFKLTELIDILADLQQTDVKLKTSGGPPRQLLESVIIRICRGH
ncbi:DNA polymerase III subunit delta [Desulfococcus sp.]|uniref:DNA polymerase III subunit delta n=1 Tax=Desulfococcus sp. TaxID=2025834 RepID=UPI003593AA94